MRPDVALSLSLFATQWVWNANIHYYLTARHPTQVND